VTTGPYRAMPDVLGAEERAHTAIEAFGRWRSRYRALVFGAFMLAWVAIAPIGYVLVQNYQLDHTHHIGQRAIVSTSVGLGCALPFLVLLIAGTRTAAVLTRRRAPSVIARLAADYRVDPEEIRKYAAVAEL
jgi:hypothetical protein